MQVYNVQVVDSIVTSFNEEYQDWSGDSFSKGGFELGKLKSASDKPTMQEIVKFIKDSFLSSYGESDEEIASSVSICDGIMQYTVLEDEDGLPCEDGLYLADYVFRFSPVQSLDLSYLE